MELLQHRFQPGRQIPCFRFYLPDLFGAVGRHWRAD
jgi:hypothetical protein